MATSDVNFGWQSREDKIRENLKITPKNKLIWLKEFNEFVYKVISDEEKRRRFEMRHPENF